MIHINRLPKPDILEKKEKEWTKKFLDSADKRPDHSKYCNNKRPNSSIPVNKVLNPCANSDEEIQSHLGFEDEIITVKNNSEMGLLTIQKFRLDKELLDYLRLKQLSYFKDVLLQIRKKQLEDKRKTMTKFEKESLIRFSQPDHPFSLMFKTIMTKYGIIEDQ